MQARTATALFSLPDGADDSETPSALFHRQTTVRSFPTREERTISLERLYTSTEWLDRYDTVVSGLLVSYETVVFPVAGSVVAAWIGSSES